MIRSFHGVQGGGKTISMIASLRTRWKERGPCQVYTNIESLVCPESIYLDRADDMLEISEGQIVADELGIFMPAQWWQETGRDLIVRINQMRHDGLDFDYSVQRWEAVNPNIREQTAEFVRCRRIGPVIMQVSQSKVGAKGGQVSWLRLTKDLYEQYDTKTNIGAHGGSVATLTGGARSLACRRACELRANDPRNRKRRDDPLVKYHFGEGVFGGPMIMSLTDECKAVIKYLRDRGGWQDNETWAVQVHRERRRRRWLAWWHLTPDDAPLDCHPGNPWLKGFDPVSVRERNIERDQERAAETLVVLNQARRRSSRAA